LFHTVTFSHIIYSSSIQYRPVPTLNSDQLMILGVLRSKGVATSLEIQSAIGKSQPTVSRLVAGMSDQVLTLGRGRATAYAFPQSIRGASAQQPVWLTDDVGSVRRAGTLSLLENDTLHVESEFGTFTTRGALPWPLAPLRAQGFLGRLLAQRLSATGLGTSPEQWPLASILFAALQLHDAPGALTIGTSPGAHGQPSLGADPAADLDAIAADIESTLPAGSSAGGEQPKFLAVREADGQHVLVKFTPPRDTPFGERWHDLLVCEDLAGKTLRRRGIASAASHIVESGKRTYLVSDRFDRVGANGRRHVVSIGAAHAAFSAVAFNGWGEAAESLSRQGRLSVRDVDSARVLQNFGRSIGNSDMHSGNLALFVDLTTKPKFSLAPSYDMLPMRWRPDGTLGGAPDYAPFEIDSIAAGSPAHAIAQEFWDALRGDERASSKLRGLSGQMLARMAP
jgi:hypothetical protein